MCPCQASFVHSSLAKSNRRETFRLSGNEGGFVPCYFCWKAAGRLWHRVTAWPLHFSSGLVAWRVCVYLQAHVCRSSSLWRAFSVLDNGHCWTFPASSSSPVNISLLRFYARSLNETHSFGTGEEDCFSPSWELSVAFCDDVQYGARIEQNRDGGDNDCLV